MTKQNIDPRTPEGLELVLGVARSAAREAGSLVFRQGFRRAPTIEHKGAVDLVTAFDRESEALLRRRLGEALPFAIVGEEEGGHAEEVVLYVDPIDGTTNFAHGHPFWCISIGLVVADQPVLGLVIAPALGIEWSGWIAASGERRVIRRSAENAIVLDEARLGDSATAKALSSVSAEPCSVSKTAALNDALLATGFPHDRRTSADNNFDAFMAIKKKCQGVRRCGSAAIDLCLVADGTYDGYWERKLKPWDVAGGIAIVRAAGGKVTNFEGGPSCIDAAQVLATNGAIHDAVLAELDRVKLPPSGQPAGTKT